MRYSLKLTFQIRNLEKVEVESKTCDVKISTILCFAILCFGNESLSISEISESTGDTQSIFFKDIGIFDCFIISRCKSGKMIICQNLIFRNTFTNTSHFCFYLEIAVRTSVTLLQLRRAAQRTRGSRSLTFCDRSAKGIPSQMTTRKSARQSLYTRNVRDIPMSRVYVDTKRAVSAASNRSHIISTNRTSLFFVVVRPLALCPWNDFLLTQ